jgi:nicotinamidase-related amidase
LQKGREVKNKDCLIVVDMLNEFVTGKLGSDEARAIVDPIRKLIDTYRERDESIAWICDAHSPVEGYRDHLELELWGEHAIYSTPAAEIFLELRPDPLRERKGSEQVFLKQKYGGFGEGIKPLFSLGSWLRARYVDQVTLVGTATHICVQHTAYEAFSLGLKTRVCSDATCAFPMGDLSAEEVKQRALDYMRNIYGTEIL